MAGRVRVYLASSLDGFIAGPDHDLSWLDGADAEANPEAGPDSGASPASSASGTIVPPPDPDLLDYYDFIEEVGALLMGRRTYDVVRGFDVPWPYGERPVLVATNRPLDEDPPPTVRAVAGSIEELIAQGLEAAAGKDLYLDGGVMVRQAAEAGLIDDLTVTIAPIALGEGVPLFAGLRKRYPLEIRSHRRSHGGMVEVRMVPAGRGSGEG